MQPQVPNTVAQPLLNRLRITEIFTSLQGESNTVGIPTVFIRLTGCPLRCQYCDTSYAFSGGKWMYIEDVLKDINTREIEHITVTGGEPLAQKACFDLLTQLCDKKYIVSLETSGAIDVSGVDPRVSKIMDIKTPASNEEKKNRWENISYLNEKDQVKFVICDQDDYVWAKQVVDQYKLDNRCEVLFSPSHTQLKPNVLAEWILSDKLKVRFQIQLHKVLWGDVPGK